MLALARDVAQHVAEMPVRRVQETHAREDRVGV